MTFPPEQPTLSSDKILGDTLLSNGKIYRIFESRVISPPIPGKSLYFSRMDDSLRVFYYTEDTAKCPESEFPAFKLAARDREVWSFCLTCDPPPWNQLCYQGLGETVFGFYPYLDTTLETKKYCYVHFDTTSGDTTFDYGSISAWPHQWLARGIGIVKFVGDIVGGEVTLWER